MNTPVDHEKAFFNFFLAKPSYLRSLNKNFFANPDIDVLAQVAKEFYIKYSEAPSVDQMKALTKDLRQEISDDITNSIYSINIAEYEKEWLKRTAEAWIKWRHFDKKLIKTIEFVKTQNVSPENVEDVVNRAITMIADEASINFDADLGIDFFNADSHRQRKTKKIETGWSFVDRISNGGYDPKTLIIYAGRQGG